MEGLKSQAGWKEALKVEQVVQRKVGERRALIAQYLWLDEPCYYLPSCNYEHMYRLTYDQGAAYTCANTTYAGPS